MADEQFELAQTSEGLPFYQPSGRKAPPPPPGYTGDPTKIPVPPEGYALKWDGQNFSAEPVGQAAPVAAPKPAAPPEAPPASPGLSDPKTGVFPFNYWNTYGQMEREARTQMSEGINEFGEGEKLMGGLKTGLGALATGFAPIHALARSVVGHPIENTTGIPKEYTEFASTLAVPGLGLTKTANFVRPKPGVATPPARTQFWPKPAQRAEEMFSPETVSPQAERAVASHRQQYGIAARDTATTEAQLEAWHKPISKLPPAEGLGIMHYIEGTGAMPNTPQLRVLADTLRANFKQRRAKLEALPSHAQMNFIEDYFPHFWKDPNAAKAFAQQWTGGVYKQGSGASTRARTVPTIQDGINAGLEPLTTNPIEATLRYVTSMDKYIASQEVLGQAIKDGTVIYARPKLAGASGHPQGFKVPDGYVALEGRGSTNATGQQAYAPEAWARIYNNFISPGMEAGQYAALYNSARTFTNFLTQLKLAFSGYHAFTMAEASMASQMAKTLREIWQLDPKQAAKEFGKAPVAPVTYATKGRQLKDVYLGKTAGSAQDREIVDLVTHAGGRMGNIKHAIEQEYGTSALGSYLTSFRRGRLRAEMMSQVQDMKGAPVMGTFRTVASNLGRVMDQFNQPLFQHYIPAVKNGAAYEMLGQWLRANPGATQAEKLAAARRVVDSVDNRFGEMIHDNIFWNRTGKQISQLAMLSYSWNMGGWREIGGGLRDIARTTVGRGEWTPKADYVVGMTINWAIMSAVYQYLKTGEAPADIRDLAAPRTGGSDYRTGEPERIIPPGIMKDVFGYWEHGGKEALNKLNPGLVTAMRSSSILGGQGGSDWRGDPILSPKEEGQSAWNKAPEWLAEYFRWLAKDMAPIQMQQAGRGPEIGSNLSTPELAAGIRVAPRQFIDPEGHENMRRSMWMRRWSGKRGRGGKLMHDARERERYGGPQ